MRVRQRILLALTLALGAAGQTAHGGALNAVAPAGASVQVPINITGTGFDADAANNRVTFQPSGASGGSAVSVIATRVVTLDAAGGIRRLTVTVPDLPLGPTSLRVTNLASGEVSEGQSIDVIAIALPEVTAGVRGAASLRVRITGSPLARFVAGSTRAAFGPGVTVNSTTVESSASLVADVSIPATAALGPRPVSVITPQQTAMLPGAFTVTDVPPPVNQAPVVNAGTDQTITLPAHAQLSGTVTDDGLPAGAAVTRAWTKASGPGTVTFGDGADPATTATFGEAGTYVLRLTATDTALSSSDEVTVTVNAAPPTNQAPVVNAGTDQTITLPAHAQLSGNVTDDGLPAGAAVTRAWTKESGPGTVTFANASDPATTATFGQAGTYVLRLTATDTALSSSDEVTITVNAPPPTNQAPVVNAGTDQTITLPAHAQLSGTVSDDGLPAGAAVTRAWTKESGPGTVTFANALDPATTATFGQAGTYVLRLSANDGAMSAFDDVSVTVHGGNAAPVARLTGPATASTGQLLAFDGTGSTDPDGDPLTYAWTFGDGGTAGNPTVMHTYGVADRFTVTLTVRDGKGGVNSASLAVTVTQSNRPPVARPGGPYAADAGAAIALSSTGSTDPDGDALTYSWNFGDGSSGSGPAPTHAYALEGSYTVTLTVSDGRDGVHTATTTAAIGPAADRAPPAVRLSAPSQALPGAQVTVTAAATDNVGVASVAFEIDGGAPSPVSGPPFRRIVPIAPLAAPGSRVTVRATARDAANNAGSDQVVITIVAAPDLTNPIVSIAAPPSASPGATVLLSATAADNVGVSSVQFSTAGQAIGAAVTEPYGASFVVPANTPVGTTLSFHAQATDFSGNTAGSSATVAIVAAPDTQPPTVTLTAPAEVQEGGVVRLTADAADNVNVASVAFLVDGVVVSTKVAPPYEVDFAVPASYRGGAVLRARARAVDSSGLDAVSDADTRVARATAAGAGVIAGEVYDDTTGLPLEGVGVALAGEDAGGQPYTATAATDAAGQYYIPANAGRGTLQIGKPGWTRVDRVVAIPGGTTVEPLDARLTPLGGATQVPAILGGTLSDGDASVTVSAGALAADGALMLKAVGAQGLQGVLPIGWSPVAVIDLWPHGIAFAGPQPVSFANRLALPAGAPLVLAEWDEAAAAWRSVAAAPVAGDASRLTGSIERTGQYAWLLPDAAPAPPAPAAGSLVAGLSPAVVPEAASIEIAPQPRIIFYKPGVSSNVGAILRPGTPLPSGAPLRATITQTYRFTSGDEVRPAPFVEDIVFYRAPAPASAVSATFVVTPSMTFDPLAFQQGVITVEMRAPGAVDATAAVGPDGGTVSTAGGEQIELPAGAFDAQTPVDIEPLDASAIGLALPPGLSFVGAVSVGFSGAALRAPGVLSVPRPAPVDQTASIVLMRLAHVRGATRFLLVGSGRVIGTRIVSSPLLPGVPSPVAGVSGAGRYVFAQVTAPAGYAAGSVLAPGGGPFAGAVVSTGTPSLVSLSGAGGVYAALVPVGPVSVTAIDPQRLDSGVSAGTLANAGAVIALDVRLTAQAPRVTSLTPAQGSASVPLATPIVATFSEPVDPATISDGAVTLAPAGGAAVAGTVSLSAGNTILTFRPAAILTPNVAYTATVATTIKDLAGQPLENAAVTHFSSLDTTPPPAPPAGSISATVPDANGMTTVTGTQGSAAPHDTVQIVNVTKKTFFPALVQANGSFSATFAVALADKLQVAITDPSGNQTVVPLPRFSRTNPDGSRAAVVGAEGGLVAGPSGTAVDIPPGAFPDGTVVTIQAIAEAAFPIQLTTEQRAFFSYSGGIELDFGGASPALPLMLSIPGHPGDSPEDRWVISGVRTFGSQTVASVLDTARPIDGRVAMSRSQCSGVVEAGTYSFIKAARPVGLIHGPFATDEAAGSMVHFGLTQITAGPELRPLSLPYAVVASDSTDTVCVPALTGPLTVQPNYAAVLIPAHEFSPLARYITVVSSATEESWQFSAAGVDYRLPIDGDVTDTLRVVAVSAGGTERPVSFKVESRSPAGLTVRVGVAALNGSVQLIRVTNTTRGTTHSFSSNDTPVRLPVGARIAYEVTVTNENGESRRLAPSAYAIEGPDVPGGNLVARAAPSTIPANTDVFVERRDARNPDTLLARLAVPADARGQGGVDDGSFRFGFNGNPDSDVYRVEVVHRDGRPPESIWVPTLALTVTTLTPDGVVAAASDIDIDLDATRGPYEPDVMPLEALPQPAIQFLVVPIPPAHHDVGVSALATSATPPELRSIPSMLTAFDPSAVLTFGFSHGVNGAFLNEVKLFDSANKEVAGEARLSNGNKSLSFVPAAPLRLGAHYTLYLKGIRGKSGRVMPATAITIATIPPTYSAPSFHTTIDMLQTLTVLNDPPAPSGTTALGFGISGDLGQPHNMVIMDLTLPDKPVVLSKTPTDDGGPLTVVSGVQNLALREATACSGSPFSGTLAIAVTNIVAGGSAVRVYNVNDPAHPCLLGAKLLTFAAGATGALRRDFAFPRGVAAYMEGGRLFAYAAIEHVGLMRVDVGNLSPPVDADDRVLEEFVPGSYTSVLAVKERIVAIDRKAATLEVFRPDLTGVVAIGTELTEAIGLAYHAGVPFDLNRDGHIGAGERLDLAFVGGDRKVVVIDLTNIDAPTLIGRIPLDAVIYQLAFDPEKRRLFASGLTTPPAVPVTGGPLPDDWAVFAIDLSGVAPFVPRDADKDGVDDRVTWRTPPGRYAKGLTNFRALRFDPLSRSLYVGAADRFDLYGFVPPNLTGTATYTFFDTCQITCANGQPNDAHGIIYDAPTPRSIAGAIVELRDQVGSVLRTTTTADDGTYAFVAPRGTVLQVVVKAAIGLPGRETARVVNNRLPNWKTVPSLTVYEHSSGPFEVPQTGNATQDVYAETTWNGTGYSKHDAGPFAILNIAYRAQRGLKIIDPTVEFPLLDFAWSRENRPVRAANGNSDPAAGLIGPTAYYSDRVVYLRGEAGVNTDEYDAQLIFHEWGHYFQDVFSRNDSVLGHHGTGDVLDPRSAFSEGLATAFGSMLSKDPWYVDTNGSLQDLSISDDLDSNHARGFFSEDAIAELIWDLYDPTPDPDLNDNVSLGVEPIYRAMRQGVKNTTGLTTVYSLVHHLLSALPPSERDKVIALSNAKGIEYAGNEFGPDRPQTVGAATVGRVYNEVFVDQGSVRHYQANTARAGQELRPSLQHDPGPAPRANNRLDEYVFFKFRTQSVQGRDRYVIHVHVDDPLVAAKVDLMVNVHGKPVTQITLLNQPARLEIDLPDGEYTFAVTTLNNDDDVVAARFSVRINRY